MTRVERGTRWWWLVAALLAAGALLAWRSPAANAAIDWQPDRALGEPWRWWSAAWVHYSARHLVANLVGTSLVAALGWAAGLPARAAWAWLVAWPLAHLSLLMQPALAHYGGLSGVLHAGVAVAAVGLILDRSDGQRPARRRLGGAILAGLMLKVLLERPWAGPLQHPVEWDIATAPLAHATGTVAGVLTAWLMLRRRRP